MSILGRPLKIDLKKLRSKIEPRTYEHAREYALAGRIVHRIIDGRTLVGEVVGRGGRYRSSVVIRSGTISTMCTCARGQKRMCRHAIAVAMDWVIQPDAFFKMEDLEFQLAEIDKSELITRIADAAVQNPGILSHILGRQHDS